MFFMSHSETVDAIEDEAMVEEDDVEDDDAVVHDNDFSFEGQVVSGVCNAHLTISPVSGSI